MQSTATKKIDFWPELPDSLEATGLRYQLLEDLILKTLFFRGKMTGLQLSQEICLPYPNIIELIVDNLIEEKRIDFKGGVGFGRASMDIFLTSDGVEKSKEALERNSYLGPAPVDIKTYNKIIKQIARIKYTVNFKTLKSLFGDMILSDHVINQIGPSINSSRSLFLYGPPGNGKTEIVRRIAKCLKGYSLVPYSIAVNDQIVRIYDSTIHHKYEKDLNNQPMNKDLRWVKCEKTTITAGGELSLEDLEVKYNKNTRTFESPIHVKANNGIFLIDDFGRQKVSPKDLLNRWIIPLEKDIDFLDLQSGQKFEIAFNQFIIFSTNLNPDDLVDEAFTRRIRYKLEMPNPTEEIFFKIWELECEKNNISYDEEVLRYLVDNFYFADVREFRACHPRDLIRIISDMAKFYNEKPNLRKDWLESAYKTNFLVRDDNDSDYSL